MKKNMQRQKITLHIRAKDKQTINHQSVSQG